VSIIGRIKIVKGTIGITDRSNDKLFRMGAVELTMSIDITNKI
tara:strand:+ start:352 stop:480 length:129 start_codon:yes stop_codon:yes gene_type:complete